MTDFQRVVWAEGVFLGQQHLQLWDQCQFSDRVTREWALQPFPWGVIDFGYDSEALSRGELRVQRCECLLPDGRLLRYRPASPDEARRATLPQQRQRTPVYAGLPRDDSASGLAGYHERAGQSGWEVAYQEVADQHDPGRLREVAVARPNLALLLGNETNDQVLAIKVGELVPTGEADWTFDESVIPPVCQIGSSQALMDLLRRLEERIAARVRILDERRERLGSVSDFGPSDLAQFLLLQTLRPAQAELSHYISHRNTHPEAVFATLNRLIAAMRPFQPAASTETAPAYEHDELGATFSACERVLTAILSEAVPYRMTGLNLVEESPALRVARDFDTEQLRRASLFLAVRIDADAPSWVNDFTVQAKIGAREDIESILASALPGVTIVHVQRPPNRLPVKSGYEYFRIESGGDFWERIIEHQSLALFLPRGFTGAEVEIVTVEG